MAEVADEKVEETVKRLAEARRRFETPAEPRPSQEGDEVTVSFKGTIDGEPFEGGTGDDLPVVLGSGMMVPGFESQLEGVSEGDSREVTVTFPDTFPREELRGKTATFATEVKAVKAPLPVEIDDELAKQVGLDDLAALRKAMREQARGGVPERGAQQAEASAARPPRRGLPVPRAPGHGRPRVRGDLAAAHPGDGADRPDLRVRGRDRGAGEGGVSADSRAPCSSWPDPLRHRQQERHQGRAAGAAAGDAARGPAVSRAGAAGARVFPQQ